MFGYDWKPERWLAQESDRHALQRTGRRLLQLQFTVKATNLKSEFEIGGEKYVIYRKSNF